MYPLSTPKLIIRRLTTDWKLLLSIFLGITVATVLIAGAPVYVNSLERQGINTAIDRSSETYLNIFAQGPHIPLSEGGLQDAERSLDSAIRQHVSEVARGRQRHIRSRAYLMQLPGSPPPSVPVEGALEGYFQYLSNVEPHVTFVDGRMATDEILQSVRGPLVETVIGLAAARGFGLGIGDVVTLYPSPGDLKGVAATVVGILRAIDPSAEYWQGQSDIFLYGGFVPQESDPTDETAGRNLAPTNQEELPLVLLTTEGAMTKGLGQAYPGTLVSSTWYISVDKEQLKQWSLEETNSRLQALERQLGMAMQRPAVFTGIKQLLTNFERRSFFSSATLFLLLAIMVMTVLYYLSMMVSYLVQSREDDVAILRSRGISTFQLLRLYALEGLVLTTVAVVLAPFIAMGAVAAAGFLPYFRDITGGHALPVTLQLLPFLVAIGAGVLSLAIFAIPSVLGARGGLVMHKLRSSRPPSTPIFQRYYLDVAVLIVAGLVFWELNERGQLVSGGLFEQFEVNEVLLLAPVLLLTGLALVFMRLFPLFIGFVSGESPALLHLFTAATLVTLAPAVVVRQVRADEGLEWVAEVALLLGVAAIYWVTSRTSHRSVQIGGLMVQAALIVAFVALEPLSSGQFSFVSTTGLIAMVPAQGLFHLLRASDRITPVWVTMGLWHMARNPTQYSWLVLLLVMTTGLGFLATTVGGTLTRSYEERVLYEVAADIRVTAIPMFFGRERESLKEAYLTIPGVMRVSMALRGSGTVGATKTGRLFDVLAVESQEFPYISWYREDFSRRPLSGVMRALHSNVLYQPISIPEQASDIGMWTKPEELYPNMALWMVLQDVGGVVRTVSLGGMGPPDEWQLMRTEIPPGLVPPLRLVSVQIFEPVYGPTGTAGSILMDDIHVTGPSDGEAHLLEGFEDGTTWTPLATSMISTDLIASTKEDVFRGQRAGLFSFGKDTDRGIRGFYRSPSGGPMPVVASTSFMAGAGVSVGDSFIVEVMSRLVPIVVTDTVDYFPTLNPHRGGFLLADLDNLLRHLNLLSPISTMAPNELFITEAPGAGAAVRDFVLRLAPSPNNVHDKESLLSSVRLDPLVTAGWRAMVPLSLGIIVFTAGLGYVTYLFSFAGRSRSEMGFLRSLGLSRRQMMGLLGLEHLIIVTVGLGLGTWAGYQMSTAMVSSVAVTETGGRVTPPFTLVTDWSFMVVIYAAMIVIFAAALYALTRSMLRLDLRAISRSEG